MPDITIKKQNIQPNKNYIKVDNPGLKKTLPDSTVVFKNILVGSPEARLTFFKMEDKGGTAITDFCAEQTESYFIVPGTGNGEATCTLTQPKGDFAYSIETEPPIYEKLDPIIIIEPSGRSDETQSIGGKIQPLTAGIGGLIIGAAIMYVLTKTIFANNK